jgi:hypothetical protein
MRGLVWKAFASLGTMVGGLKRSPALPRPLPPAGGGQKGVATLAEILNADIDRSLAARRRHRDERQAAAEAGHRTRVLIERGGRHAELMHEFAPDVRRAGEGS